MADTADSAPSSATKKSAAKKPRVVPSHPKVSDMVTNSIRDLKERGGSSLQAIKKHVASNHKVDVEKLSPFIKRFLKTAVANGALIQTKGKGANGSFKLAAKEAPKKSAATTATAAAAPAAKKRAAPKRASLTSAAKPRKAAAKAKKAAVVKKSVKAAKKTKTVTAETKTKKPKPAKKEKKAKTPKKPKSPKPKKAAVKKPAGRKAKK